MAKVLYLFIDVQHCFFEWHDDPSNLLPAPETYKKRWSQLLERARDAQKRGTLAVAHVQHEEDEDYGFKRGTDGWKLEFEPLENERVYSKRDASVFKSNPQLADELKAQGVETIVVAGAQSEHCVQAATRGALENGFEVVVLDGAIHTLGETLDEANAISDRIARDLGQAGAKVVPWDQWSP